MTKKKFEIKKAQKLIFFKIKFFSKYKDEVNFLFQTEFSLNLNCNFREFLD
jgi:hypothetical protein